MDDEKDERIEAMLDYIDKLINYADARGLNHNAVVLKEASFFMQIACGYDFSNYKPGEENEVLN